MMRIKMAENLKEATNLIEQGRAFAARAPTCWRL
jgi:hypothetical protein